MPRHITGVIDNDVPFAAFQGLQAIVSIALVESQIGEKRIIRPPAIEQADLVSAA